MDVIEKAKELSMAIQQDERCKLFQTAKAANEADLELQKRIGTFNLKKIMLNTEYKKNPKNQFDCEKLKKLEDELKDIYKDIMENENMKQFSAAKKVMDEILSHINSIIQLAVSGEIDAVVCQGDCSGCQGCH